MKDEKDNYIKALFQSRSEIAISVTKNKYGRLIYSVAYDLLHSHEDANECENDTYLVLWNSIPPSNPVNLKAYCLKITRNLALKKLEYYSAEKRNMTKTFSYEQLLEELSELESDISNVSDTGLSDCINEYLSTIKQSERRVFILRYWYMLSIKEIMRECHMSESRVKSILFRNRMKLKRRLIERGFYHE